MARDLMFQQEIKETVQRAYAAIATGAGESVARQHCSDQELAEVPRAVEWALGCGQPRPLCPAPTWPGRSGRRLGWRDRHHPGRPTRRI